MTSLGWRKLSLTARFGLVSGALIASLGILLDVRLAGMMENRARSQAEQGAALVSAVAIEPVLRDQLGGKRLGESAAARIDAVVREGFEKGVLQRIKIFDVDGTLVYSDDKAALGIVNEGGSVGEALRGRISSEFANTSDGLHDGEQGLGALLEVFIPVSPAQAARPTGVVELYLPFDPVKRAAAQDARQLALLLAAGLGVLWLALFRLVANASSRLRKQMERNAHDALHDALTGLPNRTAATRHLEQVLADPSSRGAAVLWLDLDGLKTINDSLGHPAGDEVLRTVAERLRHLVREPDVVARFGGDEFVLICAGVTSRTSTRALGERVLAALRAPMLLPSGEHRVTASVGLAVAGDVDSADALLAAADAAMYSAKEAGRDQLAVFDEALRQAALDRLQLTADLRGAGERGELRLHYQPYVDLQTDAVVGVEALVRWEHPQRGLLSPAAFIGLAEETGLILEVGEWVVQEACRTIGEWQRTMSSPPRMSINLAARQVTDPRIVPMIMSSLSAAGAHPDLLTVEITESAVMANVDSAMATMQALRQGGVRLAIDDFGTGYSSLTYLKQFPVHDLKIDKSFVDGVGVGANDSAIVGAVVNLARAVGLRVVAEGVETARQQRILRVLGCDYGQGYLWHRPAPKETIQSWLVGDRRLDPDTDPVHAAARKGEEQGAAVCVPGSA